MRLGFAEDRKPMVYSIEFRPAALKELSRLSPEVAQRVADKLEQLKTDLAGDVKRLRNFVPRYRLRVGDWRVLFEISGTVVQIWHVSHRRDLYDR